MKLKYYLRGLGIGIIVTTIVLMIAFSLRKSSISDEEIISRAAQLGMIMPEESLFGETETEETDNGMQDSDNPVTDGQDANDVQSTSENGDLPPDTGDVPPTGDSAAADGDAGQQEVPVNVPSAGTDTPYLLTIQRGDVCRTVCETLAANGVIADAETLRKYLFEIGYASSLSPGEYVIPYDLTTEEIAEVLKTGPVVP